MIHHQLLTALLATLTWTAHPVQAAPATTPTTRNAINDFVGRAQIHVLNSSDVRTATLAHRIGCLNAQGLLTADDCAVFTRVDNAPHALYTRAGNCSFRNPDMPTNRDSVYGKNTHAWSCGRGNRDETVQEVYYTLPGFNYPFVCNGNLNCYYDIPATPPKDGHGALPVWPFHWGSQQVDVPPGHSRVTWLWLRVPHES